MSCHLGILLEGIWASNPAIQACSTVEWQRATARPKVLFIMVGRKIRAGCIRAMIWLGNTRREEGVQCDSCMFVIESDLAYAMHATNIRTARNGCRAGELLRISK